MIDTKAFELGDVVLQSGITLRSAEIVYQTHGSLNARKSNAILLPTYYGGNHTHYSPLIGPGMALDPEKYFIIIPNMFGNGMSSSPSNFPAPFDRARFPIITAYDNVVCQERLVREKFGIATLMLVAGFSMGAQQTYHWGAVFPDKVQRILPWCGSAKTSRHNFVFLEGIRVAIETDSEWRGGWYEKQPEKGLRAMARVYAGWFVSQAFYREKEYEKMGASSVEDFLISQEGRRLMGDANNFLAMLETWQRADISANHLFNGDLLAALSSIKAKALVMPCASDMYFPADDNELEVQSMTNAEFRPIPSIWGHMAGSPGSNPPDTEFLNDALGYLLAS